MEERQLPEIEEERKQNQAEMVSENPIDEEQNQAQASNEEANIEEENADGQAEMEEEKANGEENVQDISVENEDEENQQINPLAGEGQKLARERQVLQLPQQNEAEIQYEVEEEREQEQEVAEVQDHEENIQAVEQNQINNLQEVVNAQQEEIEDGNEDLQEISNQRKAQERQAEELRLAQQLRIAEQKRIAQQLLEAEERRLNEEYRLAEEQRLAQQQRIALEQRLAEQQLQRISEEQARAQAAEICNLEHRRAEQNLAYSNKLERMIESLSNSLAKSKSQEATLRYNNKGLSSQLSNSKQTIMQLRKKKMEVEMQKMKLSKELQKLRKENIEYKEKLVEIEKIGNILVLQSTIEELKLLTDSQNQEIQQLKTTNNQQDSNYYQEQFNLLESYQNQLNNLKEENNSLGLELQEIKKQREVISSTKTVKQDENQALKSTIKTIQDEKQALKEEINDWLKKWESIEDERAEHRRTRQLDQRVSQYESQRFMGEDNDVQIISTLSDKQEKNLLLKEYLKLESLYEESKMKQEQAELKLKRVMRDSKTQEANAIRKKDYQDLLSRYRKAKSCLQATFLQLKTLQNTEANPVIIREEVNELLQGNQSRLCQTIIKNTNEQHKLINDKINEMQLTDELIILKKENSKLKESQSKLERQVKNNEKIMYLMSDEIEVRKRVIEEKTKIIEKLINNGYYQSNEHFTEKISELQRQVSTLHENIAIYQIKNLMLIKENESFIHQANHWKVLYNNIKDKLSEKIDLSLIESEQPIVQNRVEIDSYYCKECEKRNLIVSDNTEFLSSQVQTDNLYDLHYKEIKQSLLCLKKINKEVEIIPESHKKTVSLITEFKDKYEKYIEKYNAKLLELKKEKSENEAWRARAKQQIREEFQDIRDLIGNNRLVTALRQAKSLIDYLENEQEKGQEEQKSENGNKEEGEEENNEGEEK